MISSRRSPVLAVGIAATLLIAFLSELSSWRRFVLGQGGPHGYLAQTDFVGWFATARMLAEGQGVRVFDQQANLAMQTAIIAPHQGYLLNNYWPVLDGLLLPLAGWPPEAAFAAWVALGALTFTAATVLLARGFQFGGIGGWLFLIAAWSFLPHIVDLEQGQTSDLLLLPLAAAMVAVRQGRDFQAGLLLGLLLLKPQLLPIWGVALLASGRWRGLIGIGTTAIGLWTISTLLAGPTWFGAWLQVGRDSAAASATTGYQVAYSHGFKQLIALLPGSGETAANVAQLGLAVALAGAVALAWRRHGRACPASQYSNDLLALTVIAMLLATPYLNTHDLTFWLVADAALLAPSAEAPGPPSPARLTVAALAWLLPWPAAALLLVTPIKPAAFFMLALCLALLIRQWLPRRTAAGAGAQRSRATVLTA